jgi:DNA-directed RNA polymerase I subunit RPA1
MPPSKCQNCGCTNPSIRKQGSSKLFKQFSRKALLANSMRGIDVASLVGAGSRAAAQQVQEMMQRQQQDADDAAAGSKKKRKRAGEGEQQQSEDDEQVSSFFTCFMA